MKPTLRPRVPHFSSGPCAKRPGWSVGALADAALGRAHRSAFGKAKLQEVLDRSRAVLRIPSDYRLGIVAGSDTGAVEMALWQLLGARGVALLQWDEFGARWVYDVTEELRLADVRVHAAPFGRLPTLAEVDTDCDVVFPWNGTTSGVCLPNGDWIAAGRRGLTICDATSAVFAMALPWDRLDVATWSWQKSLGGEAAHGVMMLSPRAAERLESYAPPWPVPRLFRLAKGGKLIEGVFHAETINTPSLLCVEDAIDGLRWAEAIGGLPALIARSRANLATVTQWVEQTPWVRFLAAEPSYRSSTSICLQIVDERFAALDDAAQRASVRRLAALIEAEGVGYDLAGHRDAPPGLRIWGGPTVEREDIARLLPWLDWAFRHVRDEL
ncbi:MAG: phosphoserine transaminase [Alphaproteobacteria bacterium]|nr:phosphoserine transaminase [Alphaproteobacteria bacterium]